MAGHSHAANIKYRKALVDSKKGKLFGKLCKLIMVAARTGGGDPVMNLALKYAIDKARAANVTRDAIERAVKKGTGELAGETYESLMYEGYGPGGVAILAEILTDKRSRTAPELRKLFEVKGGTLGEPGSVGWQFDQKGTIVVPADSADEAVLFETALELGADDVQHDGEHVVVLADPKAFEAVRAGLESAGMKIESAEITFIPKMQIPVAGETARALLELVDALDDHDDVQRVHHNADVAPGAHAEAGR